MSSPRAMPRAFEGQSVQAGEVVELGTDQRGISLYVEVTEVGQPTQRHQAADLVALNMQCLESCQGRQWRQVGDAVTGEFEPFDMAEDFNSQQRADAGMAAVEFGKLGGSSDGTVEHGLLDAFLEGAVIDIVVSKQRRRRIHDSFINGELVICTGARKQKGGGQTDDLAHVQSLGNRRSRRTLFNTIIAVIPDNKNSELKNWNDRGQIRCDH